MTVVATCANCGDEHPVGDRIPAEDETCHGTQCPACGAKPYRSHSTTSLDKTENARIRDAVEPVEKVGPETVGNILDAYDTYVELTAASVVELTQIEGIGETTATRIRERLD